MGASIVFDDTTDTLTENPRAVIGNNSDAPKPDSRQIRLRPCATEDYLNDKADILDLVRRRIAERKLEPKGIRKSIKGWRPEEHYRIKCGFYDCDVSQRRAYQIAAAVGLKRTKQLPWSL
ncbi:hypothetical protein FV232_17095 [Methylobacterium sp. WL30]|uniref:hypothetical protein n=1 Tax=unclassified Methylobacterium TaxID=2615210 RepID=UPI0011C78C26|nr:MULTISPECIES: hypothetical protein [unclassified Methylobacterium]TXN41697.1 hypothetical protein FV225_01515 [Methylobacterium sp. WL93]TXN51065.1 hypothetical protein FV227_09635 [Methylobacterium sp. WL119]TXN65807.1 hypothetical protein FV232_17095 [Methylobacterium sp. WL30]TXN75980.1 hypothetical protein FV228_01735 [Methylobacterium sp. WL18]